MKEKHQELFAIEDTTRPSSATKIQVATESTEDTEINV